MPNTVLGKVSVTPKGEYSATEDYVVLDIVSSGGGSYMALKDVTGIEPTNDGVNWMQIAAPGVKGETGNQGVAAGFGEPTATVDDTTGTPSVDVTASGPDTAKVFAFSFTGLKGETGEQGEQGVKGDPGTSVKSIQRTSGTGAPGTTDTYTMYDSDDEPIGTFDVYNGANGTGTGDFMASGIVPMTGNLQMGGNKIKNIGAPVDATDAVRQQDLQVVSDEIDDILDGTTPVHIPAATESKIGGVIIGNGLSVTADGTISTVNPDSFAVSLPASGWSDGAQTVNNDLFVLDGYAYMVNPDSDSYPVWVSSQVRPNDEITTDGQMQFVCAETPTTDISVNILRMEVDDGK